MSRLSAGTSTLAIILAALSYVHNAPPAPASQRVIQAGQFDILNVRGDVVASIAAIPEGYPGICFRVGKDQPWTTQIYGLESGAFVILQRDGVMRYEANLMLDPQQHDASLSITDTNTHSAIRLGIDNKGEPYIQRSGKEGKWRIPTTRANE